MTNVLISLQKPPFQWKKGDGDYLRAFYDIILPIAMEYQPQITFISAGFDSGLGDPLVSFSRCIYKVSSMEDVLDFFPFFHQPLPFSASARICQPFSPVHPQLLAKS